MSVVVGKRGVGRSRTGRRRSFSEEQVLFVLRQVSDGGEGRAWGDRRWSSWQGRPWRSLGRKALVISEAAGVGCPEKVKRPCSFDMSASVVVRKAGVGRR